VESTTFLKASEHSANRESEIGVVKGHHCGERLREEGGVISSQNRACDDHQKGSRRSEKIVAASERRGRLVGTYERASAIEGEDPRRKRSATSGAALLQVCGKTGTRAARWRSHLYVC